MAFVSRLEGKERKREKNNQTVVHGYKKETACVLELEAITRRVGFIVRLAGSSEGQGKNHNSEKKREEACEVQMST